MNIIMHLIGVMIFLIGMIWHYFAFDAPKEHTMLLNLSNKSDRLKEFVVWILAFLGTMLIVLGVLF